MTEKLRLHLPRIAAAAAAGRRDRLREWYAEALEDGVPVPDLQEATLQVFLFSGYPRAIDAFEDLHEVLGGAAPEPPLEGVTEDLAVRGRQLFESVYGANAPTVLGKLESLHPDFARFVIRDAYGQVLARPYLGIVERELMAVAMLCALDLGAQLWAHVHGALRVGARPEEVRAAAAVDDIVRPETLDRVEKALAAAK